MISIILDIMGITGFLMLGCGLYFFSPILMLIVMGALMVAASLMSAAGTITVRRRKDPTKDN